MDDLEKSAGKTMEDAVTKPRAENSPAESETARGNTLSRKHEEPELPAAPPLPH